MDIRPVNLGILFVITLSDIYQTRLKQADVSKEKCSRSGRQLILLFREIASQPVPAAEGNITTETRIKTHVHKCKNRNMKSHITFKGYILTANRYDVFKSTPTTCCIQDINSLQFGVSCSAIK